PATLEGGFSAGSSATDKLANISWNQGLLYPNRSKSDDITVSASLKIPPRWKHLTSLNSANSAGNDPHFSPVSLPIQVRSAEPTGQYVKTVHLGGNPPAEIDVAADSAAALEPPQEVWDHYKNLVAQAVALFGAQHYRHYNFLYT